MLGLDWSIWAVLVLYFAGMLLLGWWSKRLASTQEGYLLGERKFGSFMMVMHSFGAGTNPGDAAGVVSGTVSTGASGIWASWMWLFGTPFYWLIAPIVRRMRCLTLAEYFEERFGRAASALYVLVATFGMAVCLASVLLATAGTAQGMMGKATGPNSEAWFYGIIIVCTITFLVYGYWGGIVAAIRTDMPQGLMIILLSFLAVPAALAMPEVGGLSGMREALGSIADTNYLSLFDKTDFKWGVVVLLCIKAPLTALALPHLISVCGAGRSEWEGRMGFTGGNLLKRICTIGWAILGLSWLAYVMSSGQPVEPDAAFGDAIRHLLPPVLQGVMLACVMGAAMSSGDAFQVTVAGLFSRNIYRPYVKPMAEDKHLVKVTKVTGIIFVVLSLIIAVLVRDIVGAIMAYFNILALVGISTAMGILWRRMNQAGVFCSVLLASITFVLTRVIPGISAEAATGLPILVGVIAGIVGSLATPPPSRRRVEKFFTKIYVPVGQEEKLNQSLDEVVPEDERLCTAGGLFLVKPRLQSWLGFVIVLGICVACVAFMAFLLA